MCSSSFSSIQQRIDSIVVEHRLSNFKLTDLFFGQYVLLTIKNHSIGHPREKQNKTTRMISSHRLSHICIVIAARLVGVMLAPAA